MPLGVHGHLGNPVEAAFGVQLVYASDQVADVVVDVKGRLAGLLSTQVAWPARQSAFDGVHLARARRLKDDRSDRG